MYKHKYNIMVAALVVVALIIIISVCVIYKHKSEELEKAMFLLK